MKELKLKIENWGRHRFTIQQWLLLSCVFSIMLLGARMITSHRLSYGFLAWNLFLASVPYFISEWFCRHPQIMGKKIPLAILILLWMLFMPNSFYILTDLFHLPKLDNGRPWFDLTLILSFAWNGIVFGILSIQKMETILKKAKGKLVSALVIGIVMWLNAFGVYIGRFLRFNSWDVFINPFSLFSEIGAMVFAPYDNIYIWGINSCFAFLMMIVYYTIKKLSDVFNNG